VITTERYSETSLKNLAQVRAYATREVREFMVKRKMRRAEAIDAFMAANPGLRYQYKDKKIRRETHITRSLIKDIIDRTLPKPTQGPRPRHPKTQNSLTRLVPRPTLISVETTTPSAKKEEPVRTHYESLLHPAPASAAIETPVRAATTTRLEHPRAVAAYSRHSHTYISSNARVGSDRRERPRVNWHALSTSTDDE
jgi:hypothetical protein